MKLRIISVGHKMPSWVEAACAEYTKRMPREVNLEIIEIKPEKRAAGNNTEKIQRLEAVKIFEATGKDLLIALDEHGEQITTLALAEKFGAWKNSGQNIAFVIGGADGIHDAVKQKSQWLWAFSKLTMPHAMVRVMLIEQLYRAYTVNIHHPYHRE